MKNSDPKRMLIVLAHPQETLTAMSGLLARYGMGGVQVVLLCATCAEARSSAAGNEVEFQQAARHLGIEVYSLGYSTEDLATVDPCMLLESITCWIDLVKPQLIITAGPDTACKGPDEAILSTIVTRAYDECCRKGLLLYARLVQQTGTEILLTVARGTRDTQNYPDWFESEFVEGHTLD